MNGRTTYNGSARGTDLEGFGVDADPPAGDRGPEVDSNSVRWVFAATVVFWLLVYAAGRSYF